jgi:hypothetical protein
MSYLTVKEVIKKINGHPDCASEFLLTNYELSLEDKTWAIKEVNRSFKVHQLPMQVEDLYFTKNKEVHWKIKDFEQQMLEKSSELC